MTGLQEGHKYSLSTEDKNNKSVIFVKLTDSAVQSIETFLNSQDDSSSKPTIQFQNNSGVISLPLNGRKHNYGFTLSNVEGDGLQSSFQCLQHTDASSLESLGFMFTKIQIHATEDSYEKTKSKMTAAELEQKNLCTKELRNTISRLGAKVNVKRPGPMHIPEKTQPTFLKPEPPKFNSKSKVTSPATLIQQPIRERIIHILAAKSYKKAELLLRLKREGISDKDKDQINTILLEVAKVKGNIFILENHIWHEVREDWEFGSKEDLQLIKRKKQQYVKSNILNGVAGHSVKQKKVPPLPEISEKPCNKKQRILFNGAQNDNKNFKKDLHVSNNNNALSNSSAVGIAEKPFSINGNAKSNGQLSKQIPLLFIHKKDLPVDKNNYFASNGIVRVSETQSSVSNITFPLQTFVHQAYRNEETNSKHADKMEITNNNDYNDDKKSSPIASSALSVSKLTRNATTNAVSVSKKTENTISNVVSVCEETQNTISNTVSVCEETENTISNAVSVCNQTENVISNGVSVCKQVEKKNVSQTQVKQSNYCSETKVNGSSEDLSVLEKIKLYKQLLNGNSSPPCKKITKKGNKSNDPNSEILPITESALQFDFSEIQLKYTKVESLEQRSQYVQEFNTEYKEYMKLQTPMKEISDKFSTLFDCLNSCPEGSNEFKMLEVEIRKLYKATSQNNSYIACRKKFEFLKAKLSHIKNLILEFDKNEAADI